MHDPEARSDGGSSRIGRFRYTLNESTAPITLAPHNVCAPVGAMAELHLDASIINFEIQEYHAEFYTPHYFTVLDGFPRQQAGYVTLGDAPGLGLALNEAEIAAHPPLPRVSARGGTLKGI